MQEVDDSWKQNFDQTTVRGELKRVVRATTTTLCVNDAFFLNLTSDNDCRHVHLLRYSQLVSTYWQVAALIEDSSLPFTKLIQQVFDLATALYTQHECDLSKLTTTFVRNQLLLLADRKSYGHRSPEDDPELDMMEDESDEYLWRWRVSSYIPGPEDLPSNMFFFCQRRVPCATLCARANSVQSLISGQPPAPHIALRPSGVSIRECPMPTTSILRIRGYQTSFLFPLSAQSAPRRVLDLTSPHSAVTTNQTGSYTA
eukprot:9478554-Pyramimonas_sp.AAC.1